ncbi:MAG: GlsB/YeaQ/YmgE family stress response membrane protein [Bacteroidales bacterium]|nr:GlsB/YeaQ/YmgE family stress response membrane protein [Bacteroidales bacterium]
MVYIFGVSLFIVLIYLLIGAFIGWLAGVIMKGKGFGFIGNIIIAILGSILGGFIFKILHIDINNFVSAVLGSIFLVFLINLLRGKKK